MCTTGVDILEDNLMSYNWLFVTNERTDYRHRGWHFRITTYCITHSAACMEWQLSRILRNSFAKVKRGCQRLRTSRSTTQQIFTGKPSRWSPSKHMNGWGVRTHCSVWCFALSSWDHSRSWCICSWTGKARMCSWLNALHWFKWAGSKLHLTWILSENCVSWCYLVAVLTTTWLYNNLSDVSWWEWS